MTFADESATWTSAGALGLAVLLLALGIFLFWRWRRDAAREIIAVQESTARTERLVGEIRAALAGAQEEGPRVALLDELGTTLDLDAALRRALEAVSELTGAEAAMVVLRQEAGEPITAAFGLSEDESSRELIGLPPDGGRARAVKLSYLYTAEEAANDEFRLSGGLAVPLLGESEERIGTLAIFWRRVERTLSDSELEQFEELSRVFGPVLENARLFSEARRLADTDHLTGLHNARYFEERLRREIARAARAVSRSSSRRPRRRMPSACTAASSSRSAAGSIPAPTACGSMQGSWNYAPRTTRTSSASGLRPPSSGGSRPQPTA